MATGITDRVRAASRMAGAGGTRRRLAAMASAIVGVAILLGAAGVRYWYGPLEGSTLSRAERHALSRSGELGVRTAAQSADELRGLEGLEREVATLRSTLALAEELAEGSRRLGSRLEVLPDAAALQQMRALDGYRSRELGDGRVPARAMVVLEAETGVSSARIEAAMARR